MDCDVGVVDERRSAMGCDSTRHVEAVMSLAISSDDGALLRQCVRFMDDVVHRRANGTVPMLLRLLNVAVQQRTPRCADAICAIMTSAFESGRFGQSGLTTHDDMSPSDQEEQESVVVWEQMGDCSRSDDSQTMRGLVQTLQERGWHNVTNHYHVLLVECLTEAGQDGAWNCAQCMVNVLAESFGCGQFYDTREAIQLL